MVESSRLADDEPVPARMVMVGAGECGTRAALALSAGRVSWVA